MSRKQLFILFVFISLAGISDLSFAQGEIDEQKRVFYRNEKTWGVQINNNGYGLNFRYARYKDQFNSRLFSVDVVEIKHPKEYKQPTYYSTGRFVYGKLRMFYAIRGGIGWQKEHFEKIDKGGISIRSFYSFGGSLGVLKPIYYEIKSLANLEDPPFDAKFDPTQHQFEFIYGKSPYTMGLKEVTVTPGAFIKFGYSFEYSKNDRKVRAFEAAAQLDAFLLKPEIMAMTSNSHLILTLQVVYRWGKVIDMM